MCVFLIKTIVPHWLEVRREPLLALYNVWSILDTNYVMGTWLTFHIGENESKEVSLNYK